MAQAKRKDREEVPEKASDAAAAVAADAPAQAAEGPWVRPAPLSKYGRWAVAAVVLIANLPLVHYFVFRGSPEAPRSVPYQNDFSDPATVERDFWSTGGLWRVENGQLLSPGVKNNPLWLKAKLPANVAVEFDVRSMSPEGDVKAEIFGDGSDHASGYILIHGGWGNSLSIIARLDEHGVSLAQLQAESARRAADLRLPSSDPVQTGLYKPDTRVRVEANPYKVDVGRTYHWRIERRGPTITWFIDGREFMRFTDPFPLAGDGHDRFGFSSWEAQLFFDNLRVEPL